MHFTEDEIREIRNRLPLEVPTVTDNVSSSDGSSALSAKQGKLLDERVDVVEGVAAAMLHVQTIYPWTGVSGIYSMVSAPDDTLNNATNARVAYELKKRTDDLTTSVNYIMQIISELGTGGGGGGGGSTVSWGIEDSSAHTVPLVVNGVSKTVCLNGYSSGGGGGTGGGYIGSTQVQTNSTPGQNLEGIGNATLSGNLSVTGTSTLTGNVTIGGTVFLPTNGKIVFGSNASTDPFIEYSESDTQFHFNKGLYSNFNVTAGGVGSGGGGGGASSLNDLSDVTIGTLTSADDGKVLAFDYDSGTNPQWKPKALTIQDIAGISSPTTGYLKYDNGSWSLSSSTANVSLGTASQDSSGVTDIDTTSGRVSDGQVLCYNGTAGKWKYTTVQGVGTMYLGSPGHNTSLQGDVSLSSFADKQVLYYYSGSWTNANLNIADIGLASGMSGPGYLYYSNGAWSLVAGSGSVPQYDLNDEGKVLTVVRAGYTPFLSWETPGSGPSGGGITGITMNGSSVTVSSGVAQLGTVVTSETQLSKGSTSGAGNAVTDISVSGHQITLTKGTTFAVSSDLENYVTLATDQHNISGAKSFTNSAGIGIGSSSNTLKYNSTAGRFEFNGNLYVTGNIVATGNVTAGS